MWGRDGNEARDVGSSHTNKNLPATLRALDVDLKAPGTPLRAPIVLSNVPSGSCLQKVLEKGQTGSRK